MKRFSSLFCLTALTAAVLTGCGSKPAAPTSSLPDWVMSPVVEGGIAATDCVSSSGNFSIDRSQATANARAALTKEINLKVAAMDKTYGSRTDAAGKTQVGSSFESVSRQVAQQQISGSKAVKVDFVDMDGQRQLCVMVAIQPEATKALYDSIIQQSQRKLSAQDEDILYQEFRASKAQNELSEATR
ncbi:MAG TPA: hypothetical protein VL129_12045 [Pseudomonas sp.]|jgi:hypothetical protein|uniref:hypothetical protein n=1 Tax=Pseudomonas sp. TaxID=306 RepID=UPI002BA13669|nr:hypothetical protein [Pseudomonas sp.]HTO19864.1 hypothetical protein [Pseudomonas sp.]